MSEKDRETPACTACGGRDVVPILYGLPGPEARERAGRGEVQLGGCIVAPDNPDWHCRGCGERWTDTGSRSRWSGEQAGSAREIS